MLKVRMVDKHSTFRSQRQEPAPVLCESKEQTVGTLEGYPGRAPPQTHHLQEIVSTRDCHGVMSKFCFNGLLISN